MRALGLVLLLLLVPAPGCAIGAGNSAAPTPEAALPPRIAANVLRAGENPRVEATYANGTTTMTLRNETWTSAKDAYSDTSTSMNLKVAEDADLQRLMAAWTKLGFFEVATAGSSRHAKASLTLRVNDSVWVRGRQPAAAAGVDDVKQFGDCAQVFCFVYDNTRSYHTIKNVPAKHFYNANQRLQQKNQEAVKRSRGRK